MSHQSGHYIQDRCSRLDGYDLKWKQIRVNEITASRELQFFVQWIIPVQAPQDGKAVDAIEKFTIDDNDYFSDSYFKTEITGGLGGADFEFVYQSANDGESGIATFRLKELSSVLTLH